MKFTTYARLRAWGPALVLAASAVTCRPGPDDDGDSPDDCARTIARLEQLRLDALDTDPVLAQHPELAREHARQTRDAFITPLTARCTDRAFGPCVDGARDFQEAARCP